MVRHAITFNPAGQSVCGVAAVVAFIGGRFELY